MTELAAYEQMEVPVEDVPVATFSERSHLLPLPFLAPVLFACASYMMGGVPRLTDFSFVLLTILSFCALLVELARFPRRFGVGGVMLFAGVLIWFCEDYFKRWFGLDKNTDFGLISAAVVSKAALAYAVFVFFMTIGLLLPWGRLLERVILALPEPTTSSFYAFIVVVTLIMGLFPYAFFTADGLVESLWRAITGGYGHGVRWTVGRSSEGGNFNMNTSWGGYMTYLIDTGKLGGIVGVFYALLVTANPMGKILGWSVWAFWALIAFGSGIRGEVLMMMLPVAALLYLKYQSRAAQMFQMFSLRAYIFGGIILFLTLFGVQFIALFRDRGYTVGDMSQVQMTDLQGNFMFSEGLLGFSKIPDEQPHFRARWPGEAVIRPVPDTVLKFFYGLIPRALWPDKPIDPVTMWYNKLILGDRWTQGNVALTVVGYWYFPYGWVGVIQGGMIFGLLLGISERALRASDGRPLGVLMSLAFAVWTFRCFRGLNWTTLYPIVIGGIFLWILIRMQRAMSPGH
jgi:hypothetical protein